MRQPLAEISRTLPALNQRRPKLDTALWDTRSLGFTWALEQLAAQSQVLEHLHEIFKEDARSLLNLAIYKLDGGNSMAAMDGLAGQCVFAAWSCSEESAHQRSIEPSYA